MKSVRHQFDEIKRSSLVQGLPKSTQRRFFRYNVFKTVVTTTKKSVRSQLSFSRYKLSKNSHFLLGVCDLRFQRPLDQSVFSLNVIIYDLVATLLPSIHQLDKRETSQKRNLRSIEKSMKNCSERDQMFLFFLNSSILRKIKKRTEFEERS